MKFQYCSIPDGGIGVGRRSEQTQLGLLCKYRFFPCVYKKRIFGPPHPGQEDYRQNSKEKAHLLIFNRLLNYFFLFSSLPLKFFLWILFSIRACVCFIVIVPSESKKIKKIFVKKSFWWTRKQLFFQLLRTVKNCV